MFVFVFLWSCRCSLFMCLPCFLQSISLVMLLKCGFNTECGIQEMSWRSRGLYYEAGLTYPGYLSVTWIDLSRYSQSRISGTTKLDINSVNQPRVFQSGSLRTHIKGRCLQRLTNHKHGETLQSRLLYHGGADNYSS